MAGTVKFWTGMDKASTVLGADKMMIGKNATGEAQYVDFEQAKQYLSITGESMPAIQGGATSATAVALPAGPVGQNRFFDASWGYWKYNNVVLKNPKGTDGIPEGNEGTLYWNGIATAPTWSISKMQALPVKPTNGVVAKNNPNPISGGTTFETLNQFAQESPNLANYLNFKGQIWIKHPDTNKIVSSAAENWITIHLENLETGKIHNLQGIGTVGVSNPIIIYSDINNTYISEVLRSDFTGDFTPPTGTVNTYIRLANKTGIGLPENVHNNEFVNTIMVSKGPGEKPFQKYGQFSIKQSSVVEDFPKMFVQLFPYTAPYAGVKISHEVAHIYENISKNVYARHLLLYEKVDYGDYVSGDFYGGEVVRYAGCKLFSYNSETKTFTDIAKTMIIIPESEFVMNSGAWIGGYHGYENMSLVNFIINNKTYNVNGNLNFTSTGLISCNSFSYSMVSVLKLADLSNYADRIKISDFINGGYTVRSRFKMLKTNTFMAYMGIVCVSKYFTQVTSDTSKIVVPTASNLLPIDNDTMSRELMYSSSDYMVTVSNMVSESLLDNKCLVRLWDRVSDTKYYRQIPTYTPAINEFFQTITSVKIRAI